MRRFTKTVRVLLRDPGWKYYWRRYLGWMPVQFCFWCGRPYWGGFPTRTWRASWMEYCSEKCADEASRLDVLMS